MRPASEEWDGSSYLLLNVFPKRPLAGEVDVMRYIIAGIRQRVSALGPLDISSMPGIAITSISSCRDP